MAMNANVIQAEQAIIGALLIDESCHSVVFRSLRVSDFGSETNRAIFEAGLKLWKNREPADVVTILHELKSDGVDDSLAEYAKQLMLMTPTAANVEAYARIVRENAQLREIEKLNDKLSESIWLKSKPSEILSAVGQRIEELGELNDNPVVSSADALKRWQKWTEAQTKNPEFVLVRTGYGSLDKQLGGGFFKTGFYVIGGRPGMGKTTTALNIAERIAMKKKRVLFLSLEMGLEQITAKRLAILSGVGYNRLYTAKLKESDYALLPDVQEKMIGSGFDVITDGVSTTQELSILIRSQKDIDIVFVDYMGILEPADEDRQKPKYEQMTNISKALKALAKKNNIPVVALSQLNRNSLNNANKRPTLADLRDTGAIEQDADGVILVHRPGYFDPEENPDDIELIVAKNRHADTGTVILKWNAESGQVVETDREEPTPIRSTPQQPVYADINGLEDLPF